MTKMNNTMATASSKPSLYPDFTPIDQECEKIKENDDDMALPHPRTPLHLLPKASMVSCTKCRPTSRYKFTIVPIISSLTKKSPMATPPPEHLQVGSADLSHKLASAMRKRDDAILEASRLKYSMAEFESKLNKLEMYCHELKSGLEILTNTSGPKIILPKINDKVVEYFVSSVSEARKSLRILSMALTRHIRQMGPKVHDRIFSLLLEYPCDIKVSLLKNPRVVTLYLDVLLNRAFFEDFETVGFEKNATNPTLDPWNRSKRNFELFRELKDLSWEDVLSEGTKHFSKEFSKFCDRKMSEVVAMLGSNRAWPEPLLQAFFNGSKSVWLVHLLANSVHPSLPIFRVDKGVRYDQIYMEDTGEAKAQNLISAEVRIMVAPGFYVGNNVVKCKIFCSYHGEL